MLLIRTNSEILNLTLGSQTLASIIEMFRNTHHVDLYFT